MLISHSLEDQQSVLLPSQLTSDFTSHSADMQSAMAVAAKIMCHHVQRLRSNI